MNMAMVERNCADCALWVKWNGCLREKDGEVVLRENAEKAAEQQTAEQQIEQIERAFGLEWKW